MVKESYMQAVVAPVRGLNLFSAFTQDSVQDLRPWTSSWAIIGRPFRSWCLVVRAACQTGDVR
jgi:hypothetical protein